ncbi:MAG: L-threonylcarbamoyladenylate synthase, partial [Oscillospiraceae bacterium]|nr:L-threonylcarbamoyladenylate synthase [Oscillospiraceae bacterium]
MIKAENGDVETAAERAAELLNRGEIVAIPTETVYGLAASIYSEKALKEVYSVKGRPQDNPVIVHISSMDMLDGIVTEIPDNARLIAEKFWPGPLTMIFNKTDRVSDTITCGMDTVAVRFPS